jgi:hypothetical protein
MSWQPSLFDPGPCGYKRRGWLCRIGYPRSGLACKIRKVSATHHSSILNKDPILAWSYLESGYETGSYLFDLTGRFPDPDPYDL